MKHASFSSLNHPNLLAIFDVGSQNGSHYLVSELLEGKTLRERLSEGPLSLRKAIGVGQKGFREDFDGDAAIRYRAS